MESFIHDSIPYTFIDRTYHREEDGGYERWMFEIDGKKFYVDGDIRFLPKSSSKVMVVDFYSEESLNNGIWETTNTESYQALRIINCVIELVARKIPKFRYYRYLAFPCSPKWNNIIPELISKHGRLANKEIVEEVNTVLNYNLLVLMDSGYYSCHVAEIVKL